MIRPEKTPDDIAAIHRVHVACFPTPAEAKLVDRLRADGDLAISLVACDGAELVGHVAFSPVTLEASSVPALGLAPVSVLASHRRRGIADQLIRRGLSRCRELGIDYVVVLGGPYYARFGFEPAKRWGLWDEYGGGDAFRALEIVAGALTGGGLVRYAGAFATLDG